MKIESLNKLYVHELKDLFSAENQILKALPKMIDKAQDSKLRTALTDHLGETKNHVKRLETIFSSLEFEPGGHHCKGIEGLIDEGSDLLGDIEGDDVIDAAIIASCQRVEHYEIAGYGVARAFAEKLGKSDHVNLLTETIEEEGAADRKLTALAEHHINFVATT